MVRKTIKLDYRKENFIMIKSGYVNSQSAIMENFKAVLESAYESYANLNESHDFIGICLNNLDHNEMSFINESINSQNYFDALNESRTINEATNVTDAKIVKEKRGSGISVKVNGKEYRYVSPTKSTEDLFRSFNGMLKHGNAGYKALNWLKKYALQYYQEDARDFSPEGRELVGFDDKD